MRHFVKANINYQIMKKRVRKERFLMCSHGDPKKPSNLIIKLMEKK